MNADLRQADPETYAVIGAAMEVHGELGHGFLEAVYQDAMAVELAARRVPFEREKLLQVRYKGGVLPSVYKADSICFGTVLVECKALSRIGGIERALLLNCGAASLNFRRLFFTAPKICGNLRKSEGEISP